jgi:hypothetical protein
LLLFIKVAKAAFTDFLDLGGAGIKFRYFVSWLLLVWALTMIGHSKIGLGEREHLAVSLGRGCGKF